MTGPTLDCQLCGTVLRHLSALEAQQVASDPYGYIVYCRQCQPDAEREAIYEYA